MINKTIVQIGNKIDNAFLERDESELCNCLCIAQSLRDDCTTPDEAAVLEYFIGNAWADLDRIRSLESNRLWSYRREDHINAIVSYRKSILTKNVSNQIKQGIFLQAYTNLGNMFSESGRVIYAIECWKEALKIEPTFGMAKCNFGHGLVYYASYQYDGNHKALILRHAYRLLQTYSNQPNIPNESQTVFNKDIVFIEKALCKDYLLASNNFKDFPLGKSNREKLYRRWVLDHGLFLNTLNDLFFDTAIAHDITSLPNMLVRDYSAPVFQGFYNQIKQEYLTARYLLYNYKYEFPENSIHFSDRDRNLVNTFDYPQYGFRYEQLKNSFKMLYSLFDKIGYFLNEYFKLGIEQTKVNFKNVWYRNRQINPNIEGLQNNPLRGLYFLSKDLFTVVDRDTEYLEVADPDAHKIFDIRNNLEHKYCKIHWLKLGENEDNLRNDPLAFSITDNELAEKTYKLLRYAREALLYLSLAVHVEEENLHNNDKVTMPLMLFDYDN